MKRFDVCTPRKKKDGSTYWHRVGTAFEGEKGIGILLDSLPMPDSEGRCAMNLFEPRERDNAPAKPQGSPPRSMSELIDDEIPFLPETR